MWLIVLMFLDFKLISSLSDEPYCALRYRRLCQGKGHHVACQFPAPGPGLSCQNYTEIKFTSELRYFIMHYINRRRQRIAAGNERVRGGAHLPRPQIMMLVSWDRELASLAQRLADQCQFVHDDCRATVRFPYAGQSVGEVRWRRSSDSDEMTTLRAIRRVLDAWWGERRRVQPKQLTAPFRLTTKGTVWGHFSQLAVWTLRAVGCGAVRYGLEYTRMLLVCDFSHTNMLGQRTINPGPLAPCPAHTARRTRTVYPLLCAPIKRPIKAQEHHHDIEDYNDDKSAEYYDIITDEDQVTTVRVLQTVKLKPETAEQKYIKTILKDATSPISTYTTRINNQGHRYILNKKGFVEMGRKTTLHVIDKLQNELNINSIEIPFTRKWISRRPYFGQLREKQEDEDEIIGTELPYTEETEELKYYKKFKAKTEAITNKISNVRHRWKQTRPRPQRPGVNALLNRPPEKFSKRSSLCSLMLDKEDVDQLFRDTGFNVNWRKQSASRRIK